MLFRLGWARVRAKKDIEKGIKGLEEASLLIKDNAEILLKLAGAIFQELPDSPENTEKILEILERIIVIDPLDCSDALILKGKLLHRKEDY